MSFPPSFRPPGPSYRRDHRNVPVAAAYATVATSPSVVPGRWLVPVTNTPEPSGLTANDAAKSLKPPSYRLAQTCEPLEAS